MQTEVKEIARMTRAMVDGPCTKKAHNLLDKGNIIQFFQLFLQRTFSNPTLGMSCEIPKNAPQGKRLFVRQKDILQLEKQS